MLIKNVVLGFCGLAFVCGPVAAAEVGARTATDPALSSSPVPNPPCDGSIQGSSPARALAEAMVAGNKGDYVGAAENVLKIPAVRDKLPPGALDLFNARKLDVGQCNRICVAIPSGSQIIGYRNATRNNGSGGDWISCSGTESARFDGECSQGFASFTTPDPFDQVGGPKVVCSVFKNWSHKYGREAYFNVIYN